MASTALFSLSNKVSPSLCLSIEAGSALVKARMITEEFRLLPECLELGIRVKRLECGPRRPCVGWGDAIGPFVLGLWECARCINHKTEVIWAGCSWWLHEPWRTGGWGEKGRSSNLAYRHWSSRRDAGGGCGSARTPSRYARTPLCLWRGPCSRNG